MMPSDVHVSRTLPLQPSPGEVGRRIVRHGLADVLQWLGEDPGLAPDAAVHVVARSGVLLVSPEAASKLRVVRDVLTGTDRVETHDKAGVSIPLVLSPSQLEGLPDRPDPHG